MNTYEVNGRVFPVKGYVKIKGQSEIIPVLDTPMMSDARWQEITEAPENPAKTAAGGCQEAER